jgi:hypothetical protein
MRRRALAIFFLGMIFLHGVVLLQEWHLVAKGFPDFSIFYTAGKIVRQGEGAHLYDESLQQQMQMSFVPLALRERGSILPFNHPPFEALVFVPLTYLPFMTAYFVWMGIELAMLVATAEMLRRRLPAMGKLPLWVWMLGIVGFTPIFVGLLQGQDAIFVLFCYAASWAWERKAEICAGAVLALGLCKFHLVLPFLVPLLLLRKKRLLAGFVSVAALEALLSLMITGWNGLAAYPRFAWYTDHAGKFQWNFTQENTPTIRGSLVMLWGPESPTRIAAIVVLSAVVLSVAVYAMRRMSISWETGLLAFAVNLVATLLVSFHAYTSDLSLLLLPVVFSGEVLLSRSSLSQTVRAGLGGAAMLVSLTPLYLVLLLRYRMLHLMTFAMLIFLVALLAAVKQMSAPVLEHQRVLVAQNHLA